MEKTYQPRVGTIPYAIIEMLKAQSNVSYARIIDTIPYRDNGTQWPDKAIWNAIKDLLKRNIITREQGLNPATNRMAYLYKLA